MHDPRCAPASPHGSDPSHHLSLWPFVAVGPKVLQDASWTTSSSSLPSHVPRGRHMDEPQMGHSGAGPCWIKSTFSSKHVCFCFPSRVDGNTHWPHFPTSTVAFLSGRADCQEKAVGLSASGTGIRWQLWPPVEYSCQAGHWHEFPGVGRIRPGPPRGTLWTEGPGGSLGGGPKMDLVQSDLGFHISSQGLPVTQTGGHTFLNLCFRSLYRPQLQTCILIEGSCRGWISRIHSLLCLMGFTQHYACITLRSCVWNNDLPFFITVLYSTSSLPVISWFLLGACSAFFSAYTVSVMKQNLLHLGTRLAIHSEQDRNMQETLLEAFSWLLLGPHCHLTQLPNNRAQVLQLG
jgi:hypothetical protein